MGAAFAPNWPQMKQRSNFEGIFGVVQWNSGGNFAPFLYHGWKMECVHTGEKSAAETMKFTGRVGAEEVFSESLSHQSYDDSFWEYTK